VHHIASSAPAPRPAAVQEADSAPYPPKIQAPGNLRNIAASS